MQAKNNNEFLYKIKNWKKKKFNGGKYRVFQKMLYHFKI